MSRFNFARFYMYTSVPHFSSRHPFHPPPCPIRCHHVCNPTVSGPVSNLSARCLKAPPPRTRDPPCKFAFESPAKVARPRKDSYHQHSNRRENRIHIPTLNPHLRQVAVCLLTCSVISRLATLPRPSPLVASWARLLLDLFRQLNRPTACREIPPPIQIPSMRRDTAVPISLHFSYASYLHTLGSPHVFVLGFCQLDTHCFFVRKSVCVPICPIQRLNRILQELPRLLQSMKWFSFSRLFLKRRITFATYKDMDSTHVFLSSMFQTCLLYSCLVPAHSIALISDTLPACDSACDSYNNMYSRYRFCCYVDTFSVSSWVSFSSPFLSAHLIQSQASNKVMKVSGKWYRDRRIDPASGGDTESGRHT